MPGPYALEQTSAFDFDTLTVTNAAAVSLTTAKLNGTGANSKLSATRVYITIEVSTVRYRYDGTAPTTTIGHLGNVGDVLTFDGSRNLQNLQFIAVTANATVNVSYENG